MSIELQQQTREELAAMFRLTAHFGWDDVVWNHITARVPGSDNHFYMHRFGELYTEVTASSLITVDENGKVVDGPKDLNTAGFIIHSAVHIHNPEAIFVFHAHPAHVLAATALQELPFLVQDSAMFLGKLGYHDWEGVSADLEERQRIAKNLRGNIGLVMRNHGLLTVGTNAGECFMHMYYLVRMCEVALQARGASSDMTKVHSGIWALAHEQYDAYPPGKYEWPALMRLCERLYPDFQD